jgi:hypothetical protein
MLLGRILSIVKIVEALMEFLNYVIVDGHFYCGLSRWSGNYQRD